MTQNSNITAPQRANTYPWLDLMRFTAAFLVVLGHAGMDVYPEMRKILAASPDNWALQGFNFICSLGTEAVLTFFVLSGFLVGGGTMKKIKTDSFHPINYSIDRFVRIMMPFIGALILYVAVSFYCAIPVRPGRYMLNLLGLHGIVVRPVYGTLWSLAYEIWFYVMIGALAVILRREKFPRRALILACILLGCVATVYSRLYVPYLFIWVGGALAAWHKPQKSVKSLAISALWVAAMVWWFKIARQEGFELAVFGFHAISEAFVCLMLGFSLCAFTAQIVLWQPIGKFQSWLNATGGKLAKFSYTLYLTHSPVSIFIMKVRNIKFDVFSWESVGWWFALVIASLAVGWIMYLLFEAHTQTIKNWIKAKIPSLNSRVGRYLPKLS